jgi:hypothetical protein
VTDAEQSSSIADPSSVVDTGQSPSTIGRPVSEIDR